MVGFMKSLFRGKLNVIMLLRVLHFLHWFSLKNVSAGKTYNFYAIFLLNSNDYEFIAGRNAKNAFDIDMHSFQFWDLKTTFSKLVL